MNAALMLLSLMLAGVEQTPPTVAFVTYDAGETLALLPVAPLLRERGIDVRWFPLTPWSADLLAENGEAFLPLPDGIEGMPHVQGREGRGDLEYWESALARAPISLRRSGSR